MKVNSSENQNIANPAREVNLDKHIQEQVNIVKNLEQQLAFENGKLRMLVELITPPQMTQPEPTSAQ